jgi:DNA-binding transcriptional LysR family regulator
MAGAAMLKLWFAATLSDSCYHSAACGIREHFLVAAKGSAMTLHRLQLFVSIAKHLSVTHLSRELRVSQSAISQQLRRLQAEFGISLLKKQGRGLELTESGRAFLNRAESIISQIEGLKQKSNNPISEHVNESLNLGGSHAPSASLLPSFMTRFHKRHPKVELTLHTGRSPEMLDLVLKAQLDIAVVTNPTPSQFLHTEPYRVEELVAFVPKDHVLGKKRIIEIAELANFPLVIRTGRQDRSRTEETLSNLGPKGFTAKMYIRCESPDAIKNLVRKGGGVGLIYKSLIEEEARRGEFKILKLKEIDLTVISYLVYSRQRPLSSIGAEFVTLLREFRDKSR